MLPTINDECGLFLRESCGKPLVKALPKHGDGFWKVKVRKKKTKDQFEETFNESFFTEYRELRNRAVFVNGKQNLSENTELFYVFPIDGYRFMYSTAVVNSTELFKDTFDKLTENTGESGLEIFKDLLQMTYTYDDLPAGIDSGCEIILYDLPYYYAIRASLIDDYSEWFYN